MALNPLFLNGRRTLMTTLLTVPAFIGAGRGSAVIIECI